MFGVTSNRKPYTADAVLAFHFQSKKDHLEDGFPADARVFSRYLDLEDVKNPFLADYVSISKKSSGEILVLCESVGDDTLRLVLEKEPDISILHEWLVQILCALEYLHQRNIICCNLTLDNICITKTV